MSHKSAQELGIHLPPLSFWPILVTIGVACVPMGILLRHYNLDSSMGPLVLWFAIFFLGFSLMGWAYEVIKDKNDAHHDEDIVIQQNDLTLMTKLMLVSEAAIFGALFVHYFYSSDFMQSGLSSLIGITHYRPEGILETSIPAVATLLLILSSLTCHFAHHALLHGNKGKSKNWLIVTIVLGLLFLGMQGHEWGYFAGLAVPFTNGSGMFGTSFYMMTGFHGAHVAIGLLMLFMVYARLEMGHFDEKRHYSMLAASWYWHFVDIVWIVLFFTVYLI